MKEVWNGLPVWAKGLIAVAAAGSAFIIGKKIFDAIQRSAELKHEKKELDDNSDAIKDLKNDGEVQSYPDSQYRTWANSLKVAFDGCGTSNGVWRNVLNALKNDLDVHKLVDAFGVQKIDRCGWGTGDDDYTLGQALADDLGENEVKEVNSILSKKNIKFRF